MQSIPQDPENQILQIAKDFVTQTSQHLFLTGKAGTGKTTFLKNISRNSHKHIVVAAPTGVAAINAGGVTLHSLFQLPFEPYIPNSRVKDTFKFGKAKQDLLRQMELLIIDEVSMLRADMLDAVDATLQFIRRNKKPFGGVQMLYIGDMFQLPPVVKDDEWALLKDYYETPFFFHAKALQQAPPVYLELKKVYRQREQFFVDLLNRVRNNEMTNNDLEMLNKRYQPHFTPSDDEKYIILCTHNYQADRINAEKLEALPGKAHFFKGEITGEFPEYALPTEMNLQLKEGAQVMFIKNDTEEPRRYYNGKIAEIMKISGDEIHVCPEGSDATFKIEKETWNNMRYTINKEKNEIEEEKLGSFEQYPIRTAWAITIHKSQGLTFEHAMIDAGRAFAAGQAYVALSRCTSLEGIILKSLITPSCIQTDAYAVAFSQNEKPVEMLENTLEDAKKRYWTERLLHYFDWSPLINLLKEYRSFTEHKISDELQNAHELSEELYIIALQQNEVAKRFQSQLERMMSPSQQIDDLSALKERCSKAVAYFHEEIRTKILFPLQIHKSGFTKMKKAKAYWKNLNILEEDIILFTNKLANIRYNNEPMLLKNIVLEELRLPDVFSGNEKSENPKKGKTKKKSGQKVENGASKKMSLEMFQKGKNIAEIAKERCLVVSTITGHLTDFVKTGQVAATDLISEEKLNAILPFVQGMTQENHTDLAVIMAQLGEKFSYPDVKVALNHVIFESTKD